MLFSWVVQHLHRSSLKWQLKAFAKMSLFQCQVLILVPAALSIPLLCENSCQYSHQHDDRVDWVVTADDDTCADGGPALGATLIHNTTGTRSICPLGSQCDTCGLRGQAFINATWHESLDAASTHRFQASTTVGAIESHVELLASWLYPGDSVISPEVAELIRPGACATLSGGGAALCCSALDNSASPYWGQACAPLLAVNAPVGSEVRCAPSGWVLNRTGFLPVSCSNLVLDGRRAILSMHRREAPAHLASISPAQLSAPRCSTVPAGNDALCCAARDGSRGEHPMGEQYGQLCVPSRPGTTFSTGSTCEPASWVVQSEPEQAASCERLHVGRCELPGRGGCLSQRAGEPCCGYTEGRTGTVWGSASCVEAADGTPFLDSHGTQFHCAPAPWVVGYQPMSDVREGVCGL